MASSFYFWQKTWFANSSQYNSDKMLNRQICRCGNNT